MQELTGNQLGRHRQALSAASPSVPGGGWGALRPPALMQAPLLAAGAGCMQHRGKCGPSAGAQEEEAWAGHLAWWGHSHGVHVGDQEEMVFLTEFSLCCSNSFRRKNKKTLGLEKLSVANSDGFVPASKTKKKALKPQDTGGILSVFGDRF